MPGHPPSDFGARPLTGAPTDRWPDLPQVLATALAIYPTHRYTTTEDFARALHDALPPHPRRD